ncbi:TlpA family protein disulfide reductase [Staphylospora marina]|uniref:TlpA family protein disulfide reductase n=1 Tax=Staphylospora marina TaxID=2490858 RepID=UPI0013DD93F0|nr:TlpA disulfide reductase family protein [Staphylospora marina]
MQKWRNLFILVLLAGFAVAAVWGGWEGKEQAVTSDRECDGTVGPEVGQCAPDFTLNTLDGKTVTLRNAQGKPTVINFWATWCPPCRDEMPHFQKAYERYKDKVRFIMVNETSQERDESRVKQYVEEHGFTFPVALDPEKNNRTVGLDDYRLPGIPVTVVVGPDGKIQHRLVGGMSAEQVERLMQTITQ